MSGLVAEIMMLRGVAGVALFVTLSLAGCLGGEERLDETPTQEGPSTPATSWNWTAPKDFTGDFAMRAQFHANESLECDFQVSWSQQQPTAGEMHYWIAWDDSWGSTFSAHAAQVHAGPVDTRAVTSSSSEETQNMLMDGTLEIPGALTYTFAVTNLVYVEWDESPESPLAFTVQCPSEIQVTSLEGAKDLATFSHDSNEGISASVVQAFAVQLDDQMSTTFDTDRVTMMASAFTVLGEQQGQLTITNPNGTTEIDLAQSVSPRLEGPPGEWVVAVDRVSVTSGVLRGVLIGFDDVAALDEIATSVDEQRGGDDLW